MIVLVFGLPGTGKTYFAKHLAEKIDAAHLNTDIVREKLNFTGHYDEKTKQQVYNELFKQAQMEFKKGADVIVDGTFHLSRRREQLENLVKEENKKMFYIEIKTSEKTARKRLKKSRKHSEADFNVYEKIKNEFEPLEKDCLELWSDREDIEEMINKAQKYIYG
ncbi:MAG: AAA family ATPase [Tangfeifania sp.]